MTKTVRSHKRRCSQRIMTTSEQQCTQSSKAKQFHYERRTKQGDAPSTFFSHLQRIISLISGTEASTESGFLDHDRDANFSNLRFADDILIISGSLPRTHDHRTGRRCNRSHSTLLKNTHHETNTKQDIKHQKIQHCSSTRDEHRDLTITW